MKRKYTEKLALPDSPGVYVFRDTRKRPLYIGRATSLRDRVKSYFSNDLINTRGVRILDMVARARSLTWQETDSVLEAILLEARLIKKYQPHYNVDERDDKSDQYVIITKEDWPRVFLKRARDYEQALEAKTKTKANGELSPLGFKIKAIFGPYPQGQLIKQALKILRKIFPFRDEKAHDPRHEAFYRSLGQSPDESEFGSKERYSKTINQLILFFRGEKKRLRSSIMREMKKRAKALEFEKAHELKRLLFAIDHINDISLIKANEEAPRGKNDYRIEAFDVAHISGTNVVGSMAVSLNGERAPNEYRKFKISKETNDDARGLREILNRRLNHSEWVYPDLIVVDGNEVQFANAENVLKSRRINIPVVAVVKDEKHKAERLIGNKDIIDKWQKRIIAVNAEAHRFAIAYHRLRRGKMK